MALDKPIAEDNGVLALLHSERPKLCRVLAVLQSFGRSECNRVKPYYTLCYLFCSIFFFGSQIRFKNILQISLFIWGQQYFKRSLNESVPALNGLVKRFFCNIPQALGV